MFIALLIGRLEDDLAGKSKIAVEPGPPEPAAVSLDIHLLETELILDLSMGRKLQHRRIRVAADNLVQIYALIAFRAKGEGDN